MAGNTKAFHIEGVGDFVLRRPSMTDQVNIARQRIGMIGNGGENNPEWVIAHAMALINVTANTKPSGFSWEDCYYDLGTDDTPVWDLFFKEYNEWLSSFRRTTTPGTPSGPFGSQTDSPNA